ncbi:MAG: hypothetical protein QOF62_1297 [Pyrinomonadaceae bacterium]|nr:hypothetical protein [Pyrinomonadaceae bacterium]
MKLRNSSAVKDHPPSHLDHGRSRLSLNSLTRFFKVQLLRLVLVLSLMLAGSMLAVGQQAGARLISFPVSIQWTRQKGVTKYRLQIASDETFRNIFFDRRVQGERFTATGLPPGYYYWRTAPADSSTGRYSTPMRFFVSGGAAILPALPDKTGRRSRVRTVTNSH